MTNWKDTLPLQPDAYEAGWTAGVNSQANTNPFISGTEEHKEYEEGYKDGKWDRRYK